MSETGTPTPAVRSLPGERRVITALFCDVVNSTTLAEQLDPEDWAELINGAFERLIAPIHRYEGTVNKLLGDGLLAFFGAPVAHEDDAVRAVLAALDMIEAAKGYAEELRASHDLDFNVRVGINTGPVVIAEVGSPRATDHTALGDAVNVAARMEHTAAPGTVQISADTYRIVEPLFDVVELGEIELKGKAERMPAYCVVGPKASPGRLRGIRGESAKLVGRDEELNALKGAIDQLLEGRGQIVCLIGEAGLGKSRLLAEANRYWEDRGGVEPWNRMYGIPYDAARPFGLFQNYARTMFGIDLDDPAETIHQKIVDAIKGNGGSDDAVALCTVAFERVIAARVLHDSASDFSGSTVQKDIYDQMYPGLATTCRQNPTVVMVDDMHWGDSASIDLMLHLLHLVDEVPVMFLCAFRPERQSPAWKVKQKAEADFPHRYSEIVLKPLGDEATDRLVDELLNIADLPGDLRQMIFRKADGNPFFVEEIVRTLIDDGAVERDESGLRWRQGTVVADIAIPDSVQALLMSRIDRLDQETKATLQIASVIGRSFYYRILKAISDQAMTLDRQLGALERVELVSEASRRPELEYMFRHELARDAAYGSILNRRRREFHRQVGDAIETLFADRIEEQAHRLAQHFMIAGVNDKAAKYYEIAGDTAAAIHAVAEGDALYAKAIEAAGTGGIDDVVARLEQKRATLARAA